MKIVTALLVCGVNCHQAAADLWQPKGFQGERSSEMVSHCWPQIDPVVPWWLPIQVLNRPTPLSLRFCTVGFHQTVFRKILPRTLEVLLRYRS